MKTKALAVLLIIASASLLAEEKLQRIVLSTSGVCTKSKTGKGVDYLSGDKKIHYLLENFEMTPDRFIEQFARKRNPHTHKPYGDYTEPTGRFVPKTAIVLMAEHVSSKTNFSNLHEVKDVLHTYRVR